MDENKRNLKQEIKDLWKEYGGRVKVGFNCLLIGLLTGLVVGFVKGTETNMKMTDQLMSELIDKTTQPVTLVVEPSSSIGQEIVDFFDTKLNQK